MAHRAEPAPDIFGLGDYTSLKKETESDEPPADVADHLRRR
jgi:hypothetical protein